MREPQIVSIKSLCGQIRSDVILDLKVTSPPRRIGKITSGAPISCSLSLGCIMGPSCLLKANLIGLGRMRK